MKYILVLSDGMADEPIEALNNLTPMEAAKKPTIDMLAAKGEVGLINTVPHGMNPGSDVANLSVIGYDPKVYYTGRSPLEAISIGAVMKSEDVCFRVNFVTLTENGDYEEKVIEDHSADEITTEEAAELLKVIIEHFEKGPLKFYTGVSYRHALIWSNGSMEVDLTPPHNILGKEIKDYMPKGTNNELIYQMMKESYDLLSSHPINVARRERGLRPANSIWLWGEGTKPELPNFEETFGKKGSMISAVDLLKGIAIAAGMKSIDVEGATGNIHTNYQGKVEAAIKTLDSGADFVYIHIEAPDECGHRGELENKVKALELIDEKVVKPIYEYYANKGEDFKIAILPDHPTPIRIRTHTSNPVPFMIYDHSNLKENKVVYSEKGAKEGKYYEVGHDLMHYFLDSY